MEGYNREQQRGGSYVCYVYGGIQLGYVSGTCTYSVQGGVTDGGGHVAGGGPASQRGKRTTIELALWR